MNLHESAEMYLETIYILSMRSQSVRSIDVAECMGYSKPSVSRAVSLLKQGGYLTMAQDGCLTLTQQGIDAAKNIFTRHNIYIHISFYCIFFLLFKSRNEFSQIVRLRCRRVLFVHMTH